MAYYPDLSPYEYGGREPGTVNVGWLDSAHDFLTGDVPPGFLARLRGFYAYRPYLTAGYHECAWCGFHGSSDGLRLGTSEIRVVGPERIYAAPTLLLHYVEAHHYLPPHEFIAAVMDGPLPGTQEWVVARSHIRWREPEIVREQVAEQVFRYRVLTVRDAYKLLYQGIMGPGHLIADAAAFTHRLNAEVAALNPVDHVAEPWEAIHHDGALVRVNLRPYVNGGHDVERLAQACIETAAWAWGTPDLLRATWQVFVTLCEDGRLETFSPDEVAVFTAWLEEHGYPAIHHSEAYRQAYRPAYRVVGMASIWQELGLRIPVHPLYSFFSWWIM